MGDWLAQVNGFLAGGVAAEAYWVLAIGGSTVFAILALLTFTGMDGIHGDALDDELDPVPHADTGAADFKLLSFRSLAAFFTVFGWGGVIWGKSGWTGFAAALLAGAVMMAAVALLFWMMYKLQHSGNVAADDFLGKNGTVYLTVPAARAGEGKITVTAGGATHELAAVADAELPTGAAVTVVRQVNGRVYLVKAAEA